MISMQNDYFKLFVVVERKGFLIRVGRGGGGRGGVITSRRRSHRTIYAILRLLEKETIMNIER